ncbi:hypothetical protein LPB41_21530 [Thalassospira sp. MA62]|nr:hypothetical protein [Thalassospira sp. MA62]
MTNSAPLSRPVLLVDTFSFHTFENSGYFYCWHLSESYDIVVMIDPKDQPARALQTLVKAGKIKRLIVVPDRRNHFAIHAWFNRELPKLLQSLRPSVLLMNNWHAFHQKYLARWVRRTLPHTKVVISLSVHIPVTDFDTTDYRLREASLHQWRAKWPWKPAVIADMTYELWGRWRSWRDFLVLPLLVGQKPLKQTHSSWLCRLFSKQTDGLFDAILCYAPSERQAYLMETDDSDKIHYVQHPMTVLPDATQSLFPTKNTKKVIVALPSSGLGYKTKENIEQQINRLEAVWAPALEIIQDRMDGMQIWWKLHPGFVNDPTMVGLTKRLEKRFPQFVSMTGKMSAEEMMVSASVVVGDVSTTLIWASRLKTCKVLSLDLFGVEGGDEMGLLPDITVIRSFSELNNIDLQSPETADTDVANKPPTPLEFLQELTKSRAPTVSES